MCCVAGIPLNILQFIHPIIDGHLGYFEFWANMNKTFLFNFSGVHGYSLEYVSWSRLVSALLDTVFFQSGFPIFT